jgi:tetratricopeptide (TPR) repeat protein
MIERRYGAFLFVLWVALSFAVAPGRAQSSEDIGALNKQVDELVQRGNYTEATVLALRALAAVERQLGPDNQDVALHLNKVARLYEYRGLYDDAEPLRKRALATMEQALGPDHLGVAGSKEMLARLYRIQQRYADAEQLLKGALATREKVVGLEGVGVCQSLGQLAVLHETRGVYADAEPYRTRCLAILEKAVGRDRPDVGQSLHELARLYRKLGRAEATPTYSRAMAVLGPNHPEAILAAINAGEYEKAARALGLGGLEGLNSEGLAQRVRRTFFGQVTDLRWTGYRFSSSSSAASLEIEGEATHGNALWQPFAVQMVPEGSGWKLRAISILGLAWKQ